MSACAFLPPLNRHWHNLPIPVIDSVRSCLEIAPGVPECAAFYESIMQYLRKNEDWSLRVPVDDPVIGVMESVIVYIRHTRETIREKNSDIERSLGIARKTQAWSEFRCSVCYSPGFDLKNIFDSRGRELRPLLLTAVRLAKHARKHHLCKCRPPCCIPPGKRGLCFCKECGLASHESIRDRHIIIPSEFAPKVVKATPMVKPGPPSFNLYDRGNINRCLAKRAKPRMLKEAWKSCRCSSCLEDLTVMYEETFAYGVMHVPRTHSGKYGDGELFSKREKDKLKPRIFIPRALYGFGHPGFAAEDFTLEERDKLIQENPILKRCGIFSNAWDHEESEDTERRVRDEFVNMITGTGNTYEMERGAEGYYVIKGSGEIRCFWKCARDCTRRDPGAFMGGGACITGGRGYEEYLDARCPCEECKVKKGRLRAKSPQPARQKRRRRR